MSTLFRRHHSAIKSNIGGITGIVSSEMEGLQLGADLVLTYANKGTKYGDTIPVSVLSSARSSILFY